MIQTKLKLFLLSLLAVTILACTSEQQDTDPQIPDENENEGENMGGIANATVWNGATITFTKAAGANPAVEANQDRITDNVWLTRGNNGGQIYNAVTESGSTKSSSPAGTMWALGELSNVSNLTFAPFRTAVGNPKSIVGRNLVLYIPDDNVVISVVFTSWSQSRSGGFAYTRSTE